MQCRECNHPLEQKRVTKRYCSSNCRVKAYRKSLALRKTSLALQEKHLSVTENSLSVTRKGLSVTDSVTQEVVSVTDSGTESDYKIVPVW